MATFNELIAATHDPPSGVFAGPSLRLNNQVFLAGELEFRWVLVVEARAGEPIRQRETMVAVKFPGTAQEEAIEAGPLVPSANSDPEVDLLELVKAWAPAGNLQIVSLARNPMLGAIETTCLNPGDVEQYHRHTLDASGSLVTEVLRAAPAAARVLSRA